MYRIFENLKLRGKLLVSPLIVAMLLIGLSGVSYWGLSNQKSILADIFDDHFRGYQDSAKTFHDVMEVHGNIYKVISWSAAKYEGQKITKLGKEQATIIEVNIEALKTSISSGKLNPEKKKLYESVLLQLVSYQKAVLMVLDMVTNEMDMNIATMYMGTADDEFQKLNKEMKDLLALENRLSQEKRTASFQ